MMTAELAIADTLTANVVIKNAGPSIARNVRVSFDPPLPNNKQSADGQGNFGRLINLRYAEPIAVWVPGRALENFFWVRDDDSPDSDPRSVDGIPARTIATVAYADDSGTEYEDEFPLDMREITGAAMPIETTRHTSSHTIGRRPQTMDD